MIARFLSTAAHALFWAARDARDIRNGKDINHGVRWALRAAIEVGVTLAVMPFGWGAVLTTIAAAFQFSVLFRFLLNTMRGRHWNYISPSSRYDWWFMLINGNYRKPHSGWTWSNYRAMIRGNFWLNYEDGDGICLKHTHRAGTLAYITEAVVFAILAYLSAVVH